eukprot:jgi/Pico_ML_1/52545/g3234.t1
MATALLNAHGIARTSAPKVHRARTSRRSGARVVVVRAADEKKAQVIQPLNGDPFIGMLETPVTSSPLVAGFLAGLPANRRSVSPVLRGVEIGLAHGYLLLGPFLALGPLRDTPSASTAGVLSSWGLVAILAACLSIYGKVTYQGDDVMLGKKTLTGRDLPTDALYTAEGWEKFTSGFLVGGFSGVLFAYITTANSVFETVSFYAKQNL